MIIEPLQKGKHQRVTFACGKEQLDRFLHENAFQALAKNLSMTYVAVDQDDETIILGYYTVTPYQIEAGELPPEVAKKYGLPQKSAMPGSLVAKLAVSERFKGQGVGSFMLMDALVRCARISREVGGVAIIVDALEEEVVEFYAQYGFVRFEPTSLKMFIMMDTVRTLVGEPEATREVV